MTACPGPRQPSLDPAALKAEMAAEIARAFGEVRLEVQGASMLPCLWPGDIVTVRREGLAGLGPGQIAEVFRHGRLVCHRIVRRMGDRLVTRGDCAAGEDAPAGEKEIVGRVVAISRRGRPVNPDFTLGRRLASYLLRHSEFCVRALLRLRRPLWTR